MKKTFSTWVSLILMIQPLVAQRITGPLQVHENQRYFTDAEGKPFFWLADTAWELFHRLDLEESKMYLDKRKAQGFNVVQAVGLAELDGLKARKCSSETLAQVFGSGSCKSSEALEILGAWPTLF